MLNSEHIRYPYMDIACALSIVHIAPVIVDSVRNVSESVDVFLDTIPFSGIELL